MDERVDEIQAIKNRETLLRAELKELKARRDAIEREIEEEMIEYNLDDLRGTNCRVEFRESKSLDKELVGDSFPYELFPEIWTISANEFKKMVGADEYANFTSVSDLYLKLLS